MYVKLKAFQDRNVAVVALAAYGAFGYGCLYRTARLIDMDTIIEPAVLYPVAHFGEVVGQFFGRHVYNTELLNTGRINNAAAAGQVEHFGKGGGVLPFTAPARDFLYPQVLVGYKIIDQRAFTHTRMPAKQRRFILKLPGKRLESFALYSRSCKGLVADSFKYCLPALPLFVVGAFEQVGFVEYDNGRYMVGFGRKQEAVYKTLRRTRLAYGSHQQGLVYISGYDMFLMAIVRRGTHHIIMPVENSADHGSTLSLVFGLQLYLVAYGNRVGRRNGIIDL